MSLLYNIKYIPAMEILTVYPGQATGRNIDAAVEALRNGDIVIYPTDTVYALGCDALNQRAIERLCRIKGLNPDKNQLSVICDSIAMAAEYARIDNTAFRMIRHNTPGAITFILPAATTLPKIFKGRKTVGIRIPDNDIARALAAALGHPVLTTSAETEDPDDLAHAEAVALHYDNHAALALDGGECGTEPGTVVDLTDSRDPRVLRQGPVFLG